MKKYFFHISFILVPIIFPLNAGTIQITEAKYTVKSVYNTRTATRRLNEIIYHSTEERHRDNKFNQVLEGCNGFPYCEIEVSNDNLLDNDPWSGKEKKLSVKYNCIPDNDEGYLNIVTIMRGDSKNEGEFVRLDCRVMNMTKTLPSFWEAIYIKARTDGETARAIEALTNARIAQIRLSGVTTSTNDASSSDSMSVSSSDSTSVPAASTS